MPARTPHAGPAPLQARAAATAQPPRRLGLVLAVIATAQLMVALDLTIVNVALPRIQAVLHFSGSNLEWVVNAYAVAFGGLLLGGRAGDLLERRRIFIAGLLVFVLPPLLGGFATGLADYRPGRARRRRGDDRARRAVADRGHLPGGPAAQPRGGSVLGDVHPGRSGRADRRGPAGHLRQLAVGVLRERADRAGRRGPGHPGAARDGTAGRAVRPARRDHRDGRCRRGSCAAGTGPGRS